MISDLILAFQHTLQSGLFVDEIMHGVVTLPFVALLYYKTKSVKDSLIPLVVTYMIDMDHWVDYVLFYGWDISLAKFVAGDYFDLTGRAVVPLHAWEWLFIVSLLARKKGKWKSVYTSLAFGVLAHLLWDSYTVGSVVFYSIIFRIINGFIIMV